MKSKHHPNTRHKVYFIQLLLKISLNKLSLKIGLFFNKNAWNVKVFLPEDC